MTPAEKMKKFKKELQALMKKYGVHTLDGYFYIPGENPPHDDANLDLFTDLNT